MTKLTTAQFKAMQMIAKAHIKQTNYPSEYGSFVKPIHYKVFDSLVNKNLITCEQFRYSYLESGIQLAPAGIAWCECHVDGFTEWYNNPLDRDWETKTL